MFLLVELKSFVMMVEYSCPLSDPVKCASPLSSKFRTSNSQLRPLDFFKQCSGQIRTCIFCYGFQKCIYTTCYNLVYRVVHALQWITSKQTKNLLAGRSKLGCYIACKPFSVSPIDIYRWYHLILKL